LKKTGWKSQDEMGLLSCQRISRVLTRIGGREGGQRRVDREKRKGNRGAAQARSQSFELKLDTRNEPRPINSYGKLVYPL
jgi:hypothetical protein